MKLNNVITVVIMVVACGFGICSKAEETGGPSLRKAPAWKSVAPEATSVLGADHAGTRLVGVGARGMVLLSDNDGQSWHQAKSVPVLSTLTSVSFADAQNGWAVGHDGAIIHTSDGGENWILQHFDSSTDRPLFSVHFLDSSHGVAVGLWSLILITSNGGATWSEVKLPAPPDGGKADRNLFRVFAGKDSALYVAAERGTILNSNDGGTTWTYHDSGYKGSLWTGAVADDGSILVAGLRGSVFRSTDRGTTWLAVKSGTKSSLTDAISSGQSIVLVGLDGTICDSQDHGATFTATQREDHLPLTAVLAIGDGKWQMFSEQGVVSHNNVQSH
jgi:photosystem II stability/assembly factor-like uncharacterized protein